MWFDILKNKMTREEFEKRGRQILEMPFGNETDKRDAQSLFNGMLKDGESRFLSYANAIRTMEDFRDGKILDLAPADR